MSKAIEEIRYVCLNDCKQEGCPGHIVEVIHNKSSDTVTIKQEGYPDLDMDENRMIAIMDACNSLGLGE